MNTLDHYLNYIENYCIQHKRRLTPQRKLVLAELVQLKHPIKAYDLLELLKVHDAEMNIMGVYRTLDFLVEAGLVHKVEFNSSYVACKTFEKPHRAVLLVCDTCQRTEELPEHVFTSNLQDTLQNTQFKTTQQDIALHGLCTSCQNTSSHS